MTRKGDTNRPPRTAKQLFLVERKQKAEGCKGFGREAHLSLSPTVRPHMLSALLTLVIQDPASVLQGGWQGWGWARAPAGRSELVLSATVFCYKYFQHPLRLLRPLSPSLLFPTPTCTTQASRPIGPGSWTQSSLHIMEKKDNKSLIKPATCTEPVNDHTPRCPRPEGS